MFLPELTNKSKGKVTEVFEKVGVNNLINTSKNFIKLRKWTLSVYYNSWAYNKLKDLRKITNFNLMLIQKAWTFEMVDPQALNYSFQVARFSFQCLYCRVLNWTWNISPFYPLGWRFGATCVTRHLTWTFIGGSADSSKGLVFLDFFNNHWIHDNMSD